MFTLTVSSNSSNSSINGFRGGSFTTRLSQQMDFTGGDYLVAFYNGSLYNSIPNFSAALGNNILAYSIDAGINYTNITIPDGIWSVEDLNTFIQAELTANGDAGVFTLTPDYNILRVVLTLLNANIRVNLSLSTIWKTLGFNSGIYAVTTIGQNTVDISNGTISYAVRISAITDQAFVDGVNDSTIHSFQFNVPPGSLQILTPTPELIWYPVKAQRLDRLDVQIIDNLGRTQDLNNEACQLTLVFKRAM